MWQWGPSNINAQKSDAVQANPSLAALAAQNAYAVPQGQIHGSWWDAAAKLGAQAKAAQSEDDLKGALVDYETTINGVLNMTDEEKNAWGVIGGICNTSWDTDIAMTDKGNGVWETDILSLVQGQEFKLRRGADWNFQIGCTNANTGDTETGFYVRMSASDPDTNNIAVEATGDFVIRLEWDGESHTAKVSLIPA
jgi:arabinogalactan oligomer/maltooligosaccharide transport system substrate-binding protein